MKRPGLCAECGNVANPANTCRMCGATVCSEHFNSSQGVCLKCSHGMQKG